MAINPDCDNFGSTFNRLLSGSTKSIIPLLRSKNSIIISDYIQFMASLKMGVTETYYMGCYGSYGGTAAYTNEFNNVKQLNFAP